MLENRSHSWEYAPATLLQTSGIKCCIDSNGFYVKLKIQIRLSDRRLKDEWFKNTSGVNDNNNNNTNATTNNNIIVNNKINNNISININNKNIINNINIINLNSNIINNKNNINYNIIINKITIIINYNINNIINKIIIININNNPVLKQQYLDKCKCETEPPFFQISVGFN